MNATSTKSFPPFAPRSPDSRGQFFSRKRACWGKGCAATDMPDAHPTDITQGRCSGCGALLASDAPAGLCPRCLIGLADHRPPPPSAPEVPGYRMLRKLGEGGMGTVWLAENLTGGQMLAVKTLRRRRSGD